MNNSIKINTFSIFNISFVLFLSLGIPALILIKEPGFNPLSFSELTIFILILFYYLFTLKKKIGGRLILFSISSIVLTTYLICQVFINPSLSLVVSFLTHFKYLLIVYPIIKIVSKRNEIKLLKLLVFVAFISQLPAIYALTQNPGALTSLYAVGGFKRAVSVFPNPNMFGMYLLVISLICLYLLNIIKIKWRKYLFFILVTSNFLLLLTFSRRAWVLYILSLFIYIIFSKTNRKKIKILLIFIMTGLFSLVIDLQSVIIRFFTLFDSSYASNSIREDQFINLYKLTEYTYTFIGGYGPGLIGPTSVFSSFPFNTQIDNYMLLLLLEYGFIGLFIYCMLYSITLYYGIKSMKHLKGNDYNKNLIYILIISSLFAAGFVGATPITFPLNVFYWIFIGLILKNYRNLNYTIGE